MLADSPEFPAKMKRQLAQRRQGLAEHTRALAESREPETTTDGILRVTSNSPTDRRPVLDAATQNAARPCDAEGVVQAYLWAPTPAR